MIKECNDFTDREHTNMKWTIKYDTDRNFIIVQVQDTVSKKTYTEEFKSTVLDPPMEDRHFIHPEDQFMIDKIANKLYKDKKEELT